MDNAEVRPGTAAGPFYVASEDRVRQSPPISGYNRSVAAQSRRATVKKDLDFIEAKITTQVGYRRDDLNWNIAGTTAGTGPNVLSELTWEDIEIFQIQTNAQATFGRRVRLEGSIGYGWIYNGDNQDSDYVFDNRQGEFSRSHSDTDGDNVFDWSLGAGWQFNLGDEAELLVDDLALVVLGGWSHNEQNLRDINGFQIIPATGSFAGLNSTYQARWDGPWLGIELTGRKYKFSFFGRFEYHWPQYDAEADWNLRDDFQHPVSFTHDADGEGTKATLGIAYDLDKRWSIFLQTDVVAMDTNAGTDRTYFSDGSTGDTRLNNVNWDSFAVTVGALLRY